MPELAVVHLLWGPLGADPVQRFAASYRRHPAGIAHRLVALFNGYGDERSRHGAREALVDLGAEEVHLERPVMDLDAYRQALERVEATHLLFLNSYAEVLADGWLAKLATAATAPGAGIVGATGSWESGVSAAPFPLKPVRLPLFPRFPNPHVRTSGFMVQRDIARSLRWPPIRRKLDAWRLEGGRRGITRQMLALGLRAEVVGRDGVVYAPADWHASATFRAGGQRNLLLADNRTRDYDRADPALREMLERYAWGRSSVPQGEAQHPAADGWPGHCGQRDVERQAERGAAE